MAAFNALHLNNYKCPFCPRFDQCKIFTLVWHHYIFLLNLSDKRTPLLAVAEILLILVNEPGVVFASHQDDRSVGAESPDLLVPHCPAVLQRDHSASVITHEDHVSAAIGEPPVLIKIK